MRAEIEEIERAGYRAADLTRQLLAPAESRMIHSAGTQPEQVVLEHREDAASSDRRGRGAKTCF